MAVGFDVLDHMWSFEKKTFKEKDDDGPLESNVGRGFMAGMASGNALWVLVRLLAETSLSLMKVMA